MVELGTWAKNIAVNLAKCRNTRFKHIEVVIVNRHSVISKVDSSEFQLVQVIFVVLSILQSVPVHPEVGKFRQMVQVFQLFNLVIGEINSFKLRIILKVFELGNLILLHVDFFKIKKCVNSLKLSNKISLKAQRADVDELFKALNFD